jgi:hypothetical protein
MDWEAKRADYRALIEEREAAAATPDPDAGRADLQVAALATASWALGLAELMTGRPEGARVSLSRAAEVYRQSYDVAPPGAWGRPLAAIRCRLIGGDEAGAAEDADWALADGAASADSPVGRYTAALALLVLGRDAEALQLAEGLTGLEGFSPKAVAEGLVALARHDSAGYAAAAEALITDFEGRDAFLEDVAVADTVLVLDRLAAARGIARPPRHSALLP